MKSTKLCVKRGVKNKKTLFQNGCEKPKLCPKIGGSILFLNFFQFYEIYPTPQISERMIPFLHKTTLGNHVSSVPFHPRITHLTTAIRYPWCANSNWRNGNNIRPVLTLARNGAANSVLQRMCFANLSPNVQYFPINAQPFFCRQASV